jgi:hypothetical protein
VLLRMSDMPSFERVNFLQKYKDGLIYLAPRSVAEKVPLKQPELQLA